MNLLTSDEDAVEAYEIRRPASYAATLPYQDAPSPAPAASNNSQYRQVNGIIFALLFIGVIVSVAVRRANWPKNNPEATLAIHSVEDPNAKFDTTLPPEDPRSVESALKALRALEGDDTELPTVDEFEIIKERAELAKRRIEERKANRSRGKTQLEKAAEAQKAMTEFVAKQEGSNGSQNEAQTRQPRPSTGNPLHDAMQRRIDQQQAELDRARKRESTSPSLKAINDLEQMEIDSQQRQLDQQREWESNSQPTDPNKIIEDMMRRSRERQQRMRDQVDEMRSRINRGRIQPGVPNFEIPNRSGRTPQIPSVPRVRIPQPRFNVQP